MNLCYKDYIPRQFENGLNITLIENNVFRLVYEDGYDETDSKECTGIDHCSFYTDY